ncbi:MAG: tRNA (adenosine(37)-N6)-dimethylallyltransferase MiaA [Betaproteobacteria bacterium]|nr:tRNA (adenosine(37)-N6)-dimethylallyltransferase MiaA [Betaproteobacteria bacterium]
MGPTASGKSQLAMALATRFPLEIISVDSAQVYRGMDIGTAKPGARERAEVPHHLIDIIDPTEAYSAARFREDALRLIKEIHGRRRIALLVGGTMLYFKALREGLSNLPAANAAIRADIDAEALQRGWSALHSDLSKIDPVAAARIKIGDTQRIQRALEIYRISGRSLSSLTGEARKLDAPFRALGIALMPTDRALLHQGIAERMERMLRAGLVEELRGLRERFPLDARMPSMRCVGYRQAWEHLEGKLSRRDLLDRAIIATRQLAKRQLTWIRATLEVHLLDSPDTALTEKAIALIATHTRATATEG